MLGALAEVINKADADLAAAAPPPAPEPEPEPVADVPADGAVQPDVHPVDS